MAGLAATPAVRAVNAESPVDDDFLRCSTFDPEVQQTDGLLVWQELFDPTEDLPASTNLILARFLDPVTGDLHGTAADEIELTDTASFYGFSRAGPNFANGSSRKFITYSFIDLSVLPPERTVGAIEFLPDDVDCGKDAADLPDCFDVPTDPALIPGAADTTRAVVYSTEEEEFEDLAFEPRVIYRKRVVNSSTGTATVEINEAEVGDWFDLGAGSETALVGTGDAVFARINEVDGTVVAITDFVDGSDVRQVTNLYIDGTMSRDFEGPITGESDPLDVSFDPDNALNKFNPFMWDDPATSRIFMVTRVDGAVGVTPTESKIAIWYFDDVLEHAWIHLATLDAEDIGDDERSDMVNLDRPFVLSPEPFVFNGRSFIVLGTSDQLDDNMNAGDGEIFVIRLATSSALAGGAMVDWSRRVSDDTQYGSNRARFEGEVYVVGDGTNANPTRPIVYYTAIEDRTIDDLAPCDYNDVPPDETEFRALAVLRRAEVCPPGVDTGPCP